MKKLYISLIFLSVFCSVSGAREKQTQTQIEARNVSVGRVSKDVVSVSMDIILPAGFKVKPNNYARIVPVLGEEPSVELPEVIVTGRRREIVAERTKYEFPEAYELVRREKKTRQVIKYDVEIPYQDWMSGAGLAYSTSILGCCNKLMETKLYGLDAVPAEPEPYEMKYYFSPVVPEKEYKVRTKQNSAYIDYPVNMTRIFPDYRNNPAELARMQSAFGDDSIEEVYKINVHGYASPEGPYSNNERLARERTATLVNYIKDRYGYPLNMFEYGSTPEDWAGLRKLVENSDIEQKRRILEIIDGPAQPDEKERQLKQLGSVYTWMLKEWFPGLRHSDYAVEYKQFDYDASQALELVFTRPELLSEYEMYEAALLAGENTDAYYRIMKIACETYPESWSAHLNAAVQEMNRGNIGEAKKYLEKSPESAAILNLSGCVAMMEGDLAKAEALLEKAVASGSAEAVKNLDEARKKMENKKLRWEE